MPPYDEDDDGGQAPAAVAQMRAAIAGADAVLFSTPEYNPSIPGQLKNALDWASRPTASSVLREQAGGGVGASTGAFGAVWAQAELRKVLSASGARVVEGSWRSATRTSASGRTGACSTQNQEGELREIVDTLVAEVRPREAVAA